MARSHPSVATSTGALRVDDDMRELLDAHAALRPADIGRMDVAQARASPTLADAVQALLRRRGRSTHPADLVPGVSTKELRVHGAEGPLEATLYTPSNTGPLPVVLYFHGGGWVIGDRRADDASARGLAGVTGAMVLSVDYRRAPEHRFPAAWDDAFAAFRWVQANAGELGGNARRLALAGEGAGGTLALATAIAVRDAGLPPPLHVLAVSPVTQPRRYTEAELQEPATPLLDRTRLDWFLANTVRSEADLRDARLQLVDAQLRGLPSVTLVNACIDPLREDGARMEEALIDADVSVSRHEYEGVTHGFFGCAAVLEKARTAQGWAGDRLATALAELALG